MQNEIQNNQNNQNNQKPPRRPDKRDLLSRRRSGTPVPSGPGKNQKSGWPLGHRIAFIILLTILGIFLWKQMNPDGSSHGKISYSEFVKLLNDNKIVKVKIRDSTLFAELSEQMNLGDQPGGRSFNRITVNIGNYDHTFVQGMVDRGIELSIEPERTWVNMLISTLPWIVFLGIWLFILRQMQGGPKGVFTFGKSKAKLMADSQQKVTFEDVAGVEEAKVELQEVIEFLKDPRKFQRLGGKIPKGALLVGPPGTGKTLLARAVAGEAGVPFFSMSGSDFVEMFVGVGASRVRDLFEQGKANAPCILFIDEIDAVGRQRGAGIGGGHDEREQTLNQLLVEMDGFESNDGVILLAATNRPDVLDPALLRPGRFDRMIIVDWPDVKAREDILKVHMKNIKISRNVDLKSIAKGTPGMTGADLANLVNEAALLAARLNRNQVIMPDFEEAKDKVMMGTARKTLVITDEEKRLTAYHEIGHVLVSKFVPGADPVHKVSIIPRGRSLGSTHFLPADEKHNWSYSYCIGKLAGLLGGRAAEIIKFGEVTNGASNDIENATKMARKMVCEWGMSKRLGPLAFGSKEHEIFIGRDLTTHKDYSEETSVAIDQEIRRLVETAQQNAESIIRDHMVSLEALTEELLKREMLTRNEIDRIMDGGRPQGRRPGLKRRRRRPDEPSKQSRIAGSEAVVQETPVMKAETAVRETTEPSQLQPATINVPGKTRKTWTRHRRVRVEKKERTETIRPESSEPVELAPSEKSETSEDTETKLSARRTRMIRLKIGGRRKTIRKAPAQKIRHIN